MSLYDLIKTIRGKNYLFEVIVPGKESFPRQNADQVDMLHGRTEDYFIRIARANNVETLTVNLYAKNGSTYLRKETVVIDIPAVVEKSTTAIERSTTAHLNGMDKTNNTPAYQNLHPMITKADIEVVQFKTENKFLNEKVDELKNRNKELERKNDEYYNENLRLTREHATEKDKRDLEFKQKEMDLISKQKQGISGLMDDVKTLPPEAWQFIAGLMPNHPMAKGLTQGSTTDQQQLNGAIKHTDSDAQACIEVIDSLLLKQSPEIAGMVAMLIEHFTAQPAILKAVYDKFFPQQVTEKVKEQTTTNPN